MVLDQIKRPQNGRFSDILRWQSPTGNFMGIHEILRVSTNLKGKSVSASICAEWWKFATVEIVRTRAKVSISSGPTTCSRRYPESAWVSTNRDANRKSVHVFMETHHIRGQECIKYKHNMSEISAEYATTYMLPLLAQDAYWSRPPSAIQQCRQSLA